MQALLRVRSTGSGVSDCKRPAHMAHTPQEAGAWRLNPQKSPVWRNARLACLHNGRSQTPFDDKVKLYIALCLFSGLLVLADGSPKAGPSGTHVKEEILNLLDQALAADIELDKKERLLRSLARLKGEGVTKELVRRLEKAKDDYERSTILDILKRRGDRSALPAIMKLIRNGASRLDRVIEVPFMEACVAAGALGTEKELNELIDVMAVVEEEGAHLVYLAIEWILPRVKRLDIERVISAIDKAKPAAKVRLMNLLSPYPTDKTLEVFRKYLRSPIWWVQQKAIECLGAWPTPEPLSDLLEIARTSSNVWIRKTAAKSYVYVLTEPNWRQPPQDTVKLLENALELPIDMPTRRLIVRCLARFPCKESLTLAKAFIGSKEFSSEAQAVTKKIRAVLSATNFVVSACVNEEMVGAVIDGDLDTCWSTGRPMRPGDALKIGIGKLAKLRRIVLDAGRWERNYPRFCKVFASFDGENWGIPVVVCKPTKTPTQVVFEIPVFARYIKIEQGSSNCKDPWSICELSFEGL